MRRGGERKGTTMSDLACVTELLPTRRGAIEGATAELIDLDRRHVHVPYAVAFIAVVHAIAKCQDSESWEAAKTRQSTATSELAKCIENRCGPDAR